MNNTISSPANGRDRSPSGAASGDPGEATRPVRKMLPHDISTWVEPGAVFFITVCAQSRGSEGLVRSDTPGLLWKSLLHRTQMLQWWPHLFLVMPDHVHALIRFAPLPGMRKTMNDWKRYTASSLGIEWQRDFFDHRLRHDESFVQKAHYIRMNPVRAKWVEKPEDWPHVLTSNGGLGETALPHPESHTNPVTR